jgi:hypothetical protein
MAGVLKTSPRPSHFGRGSFGKALKDVPGVTAIKVPRPDEKVMLPRQRPLERAQQKPTGPFFIGRQRASDLEWRMWRMLLKMKWPPEKIHYQVDILGGRKPGGQVLDFVIDAGFALYVIPVNGDYWHKFGKDYNEARANEQAVKKVWPSAIIRAAWSSDLLTDQMALDWIARNIGRGG